MHNHQTRWQLQISAWLIASLSALACGSRQMESKPTDGGPGEDAQATAETELALIVNDVLTQYHRALQINCPCFVQMGAYDSIETCAKWQASGPDWSNCASHVFAEHDTPETREAMRCFVRRIEQNADCLKTKPCDAQERAACDTSPLGCLLGEAREFGLALANQCPSGALSRSPADGPPPGS
jgi:hypothetical protein